MCTRAKFIVRTYVKSVLFIYVACPDVEISSLCFDCGTDSRGRFINTDDECDCKWNTCQRWVPLVTSQVI